jgi:hypothetical protein
MQPTQRVSAADVTVLRPIMVGGVLISHITPTGLECRSRAAWFAAAFALCVWLGACAHSSRPGPDSRPGRELSSSRANAQNSARKLAAQAPIATERGVAVVELFTSEGCSSCPAADRVLSRLASRAAAQGLPIYGLSFHVDYWNYLGWADRFSDSAYSERQRGYASLNPEGGIYTPQAIINGESQCVGSDSTRIDALVDDAFARAPRTFIELTAEREATRIAVSYRVTGATNGLVLNLALLQPHAESSVKSGENAGERLTHVNVVRAFVTRALGGAGTGSWRFESSAGYDLQRVIIVGYAQSSAGRAISGATAIAL